LADNLELRAKGAQLIIGRLTDFRKNLSPDSPALTRALQRAGALIVAQAKINIRRHGLIDEGRLINSIRFEPFRESNIEGIRVGSFGVPYAAFWEFGFTGTMKVQGHNRLITQAFGKPIDPTVVRVGSHTRFRRQMEKPYLRPAFELHRERITTMIREAFVGD